MNEKQAKGSKKQETINHKQSIANYKRRCIARGNKTSELECECYHLTDFSVTPEPQTPEREFLVDNLLVQIHLIIEMILVDRPCARRV